jgi:hypothetical protein
MSTIPPHFFNIAPMLSYSEDFVDVPNCCTVLKFTYGLYVYL